MQKLEYTNAINSLAVQLSSSKIVQFFNDKTAQSPIETSGLSRLIVESKSNFDRIIEKNGEELIVAKSINAENLYDPVFIGQLINHVVLNNKRSKAQLFALGHTLAFYSFHSTLETMRISTNSVLFANNGLTELSKDDILIFRILSNDGNISIAHLISISKTLKELLELIQKIVEPEGRKQDIEIILLDSGSDSNLGVKYSAKAVSSTFQLLKSIWEWIVARKFYKNKLRKADILGDLEVLNKIEESRQNKALTDDEAKGYKELILRRSQELIDLKVIPKELTKMQTEDANYQLIGEFTETRLIESQKNEIKLLDSSNEENDTNI